MTAAEKRKREREINEEQVYEEHMRSVNPTAHWAYLFGVIGGGLVFMLLLIAILGGGG